MQLGMPAVFPLLALLVWADLRRRATSVILSSPDARWRNSFIHGRSDTGTHSGYLSFGGYLHPSMPAPRPSCMVALPTATVVSPEEAAWPFVYRTMSELPVASSFCISLSAGWGHASTKVTEPMWVSIPGLSASRALSTCDMGWLTAILFKTEYGLFF